MEQITKQGLDKFAKPDQVVYRQQYALITKFIGGAYGVLDKGRTHLTAYNFQIAELYKHAIEGIHPNRNLTLKHIVLKVNPGVANKIMLSNSTYNSMPHEEKEQWYMKNGYCVEITSGSVDGTRFALMLAHMNRYFKDELGIEGSYGKEATKCLALVRKDPHVTLCSSDYEGLKTSEILSFSGVKISDFVYLLNNNRGNHLNYLIVDETEVDMEINLRINTTMGTVEEWNDALAGYNLKLVEVDRQINVVAIG